MAEVSGKYAGERVYLPKQVATLQVMAMSWATNMVQSSAPAVRSSIHRVYSRRPKTTVDTPTSAAEIDITSPDRESDVSIVAMMLIVMFLWP